MKTMIVDYKGDVLSARDSHMVEWLTCEKCELGCRARRHVLGEILPYHMMYQTADVVFIGEGPGEGEDIIGRPFIGAAGKKLREAIVRADPKGLRIGLTNLVACRPQDKYAGNNRTPLSEEVAACAPRLREQLELWQPQALVYCGKVPQEYMQKFFTADGEYDSKFDGPILATRHPAWFLYNDADPSKFEEYIQEITTFFEKVRNLKSNRISERINIEN